MVARTGYIFRDPAAPGNTYDTYTWDVNASEVDGPNRPSTMQYEGKAGGQGIIPTQGADQPMIFSLTGSIIHKRQFLAFWHYRYIRNSFYWTDEEGNVFEVTMTGFEPKKVRVARNYADSSIPLHKWTYTMTLQVLRVISGDLVAVPV